MKTFLFVLVLGLIAVGMYFRDTRQFVVRKVQDTWTATRHNMSDHASFLDRIRRQKVRPVSDHSFPKVPKIQGTKWISVAWETPKRWFYVAPREGQIKRYPCRSCHDGQMKPVSENRFRATHGDVVLKHAMTGVLQCRSCHDTKDMNQLRTPAGLQVSMNESHRLCASCHSRQAQDWAGGAHGKRETYWQGTRVVRTCTGCHNPHTPLFGKRWPKTYFRYPVQKRQTH